MASVRNVIEGLTILAKYDPKGLDSHFVAAEHDVIYGPGSTDSAAINEEDRKRLKDIGWFIDDEVDSWAKFV